MPRVFLSNLDLGPVLEAVHRNGAAVVARALADPFRTRLERELKTVPYEPAPAAVGPVRQETDVFVLRDLEGFPALVELAHEYRVAVLAHAREIRGLATYAPNEIHLQRYRPGSLGITPHLDGKRYRRLVAFFTVRGSACLSVLRERAGEELARFSIGPGSLALLRAPGLGGLRDGRQFHAIMPVGDRRQLFFPVDDDYSCRCGEVPLFGAPEDDGHFGFLCFLARRPWAAGGAACWAWLWASAVR